MNYIQHTKSLAYKQIKTNPKETISSKDATQKGKLLFRQKISSKSRKT